MSQVLKAIYQNGAFVPLEPLNLPEDSEVEITVRSSALVAPKINDVAQKTAVLQRIVQRMQANPLPAGAPHFTREELHERR